MTGIEHEADTAAVRLRIDLAYDGTDFAGWARQPGRRSVQGTLEDALALVLRVPVRTVVAGRTDAGVHATGQVVHADVPAGRLRDLLRNRPSHRGGAARRERPRHPAAAAPDDMAGELGEAAERLGSRLRSALGRTPDLAVHHVTVAPPGFDARFSPLWREYSYRVCDDRAAWNPLLRRHVLLWPRPLDGQAMDEAAGLLPGLHDWRAYCRPREGATTIRQLHRFTWRREADGTLVATVRADAFCHHMVRCLVGATIAVGEGRLAAADLVAMRDGRPRGHSYAMVAGTGLVLTGVGYPPAERLAERAVQTRARRPGLED
jgi:tRNA pseudouridine38-40 synthase